MIPTRHEQRRRRFYLIIICDCHLSPRETARRPIVKAAIVANIPILIERDNDDVNDVEEIELRTESSGSVSLCHWPSERR